MMTDRSVALHRNPVVRAYFFQALTALVVFYGFYELYSNTVANMEARGKSVSASFFDNIAPFGVGFSPLIEFKLGESNYLTVFSIAIQNTILVSIAGVITATLLGFLIGVLRLSPNWIVSRLATIYIEIFRNIPLLLQIFFWYIVVFLPLLPAPRQSFSFLNESILINKEGIFFPRIVWDLPYGWLLYLLSLAAAVVAIVILKRWAAARQNKTGERFPVFITAAVIFLATAIIMFALMPSRIEYPELGKFTVGGGLNLGTSFTVMWFALSLYTAAFIAENVRGGILAVSHGQTEAASALGVRRHITLRLIIIPQAMRVIIPPTISQFLNLTKNSTLAVAVAYEELSSLWMGIALNQTGQEILIIAMAMMIFLSMSLLTSAILNIYNKKVQIQER